MKALILISLFLVLPACANLPVDKIISTVERFPVGTVLDAFKEVKDALRSTPVPVPEVMK